MLISGDSANSCEYASLSYDLAKNNCEWWHKNVHFQSFFDIISSDYCLNESNSDCFGAMIQG